MKWIYLTLLSWCIVLQCVKFSTGSCITAISYKLHVNNYFAVMAHLNSRNYLWCSEANLLHYGGNTLNVLDIVNVSRCQIVM